MNTKKIVKDMIGKNDVVLCKNCGRYDSSDGHTAAVIKKRHLPKCDCNK